MKKRGLYQDEIKYIAVIAMLLNHIGNVLLPEGSLAAEILKDIGYFTAISMCYFLTEGFYYTRSRRKYGLRLLFFALISEFPFLLAMTEHGFLEFTSMNMIFTLFLCFLILCVRTCIMPRQAKSLLIGSLFLISLISDWPLMAPFFTLEFARAHERIEGTEKMPDERMKMAFAKNLLFYLFIVALNYAGTGPLPDLLLRTLGACAAPAAASFVIVYLYNGKRSRLGRENLFSKWFFYIFYPVHLLILGIARLIL